MRLRLLTVLCAALTSLVAAQDAPRPTPNSSDSQTLPRGAASSAAAAVAGTSAPRAQPARADDPEREGRPDDAARGRHDHRRQRRRTCASIPRSCARRSSTTASGRSSTSRTSRFRPRSGTRSSAPSPARREQTRLNDSGHLRSRLRPRRQLRRRRRRIFPQPLGMAATWDPELMRDASAIAAAETRSVGVPWNFSPVLDVGRQPLWPRLYETFGEDPYLATVMGVGGHPRLPGRRSRVADPRRRHAEALHRLQRARQRPRSHAGADSRDHAAREPAAAVRGGRQGGRARR